MHIMDMARGAYVRSPKPVRNLLAPLLAVVPTSMRFGSSYRDWRRRIRRAAGDPTYAGVEQLRAFRALIAKAHAGSPFYRGLIERAFGAGFDPAVLTLRDIESLPVLSKCDLQAAGDDVLAAPRWSVDVAHTSGSNAEPPFRFYLDKDRSAREMAFVYDAWSRVGFTERDARASLRGIEKVETNREWDPALRELRLPAFPLTRDDAARHLDLIDARGIRYIYGYPSSVELFCRHLRALDRRTKLPIKGVLLISEPLYDHQRQLIAEVLDAPIVCFYGMSEKAIFGTELPGQPGVYVSNPLYCYAELLDAQDRPVTRAGQVGRLVGTGFLSTGMPFIRYETGDHARLLELPGLANGYRQKVEAVAPRRKADFLVAEDGSRLVTIDLTPEDPEFFEGIEEFQFYQDTPGQAVIRYVPGPTSNPACAERVAAGLRERTGGRLAFSVEPVPSIASGRGGKRAFVIQELDPSA